MDRASNKLDIKEPHMTPVTPLTEVPCLMESLPTATLKKQTFSEFIRHASSQEKDIVYLAVMDAACARQQKLIAAAEPAQPMRFGGRCDKHLSPTPCQQCSEGAPSPSLHALFVEQAPGCRKCDGQMRRGLALAQTFSGVPDFPGDTHGITMSPGGQGQLVDCLKCLDCGWSVTATFATHATSKD